MVKKVGGGKFKISKNFHAVILNLNNLLALKCACMKYCTFETSGIALKGRVRQSAVVCSCPNLWNAFGNSIIP